MIITRLRRPVGLAVVVPALLALTLAGCGGSDETTPETGPSGAASGGFGGGGGMGQPQPGVSGKIAALSGKTLQVQGSDGQTSVTYTAKTTFTQTAAATADDLEAGQCVSVRSADTASATDQVTAAAVTISAPVDGSCQTGFGGGTRPSGVPSGMPSGMPSGGPSGVPGPGGMGANGEVLSVGGTSFVVEATRPDASGAETKSTITVTTSGATTWAQTKAATAKAAKVGTCAAATGSTDDTGALTAITVRLSPAAADGSCTSANRGNGQPPSGAPVPSGAQSGSQGNG